MVTEYKNTYNADGQLVKVVEVDYSVVEGMRWPSNEMRTCEYEYRQLPDGATEQREYIIGAFGERELRKSVITSPTRWEEFRDTANYERNFFDTAGRLIAKEWRSKMNVPEFGMVHDNYRKTEYEYDAQGREIRKVEFGTIIETSRQLVDGFWGIDSMYYENDRMTRSYEEREWARTVREYQYDSQGNKTSERSQIWSYKDSDNEAR